MTRRRWAIVVGTYLVIVLGFFLGSKLHVDLSLTTLSSTESEAYKNYQSYANKFPVQDGGIVISILSNQGFTNFEDFTRVNKLCVELEKLDGVETLTSLTSMAIPEKSFIGTKNRKLLKLGTEEKFNKSYAKLDGFPDVTPKFLSNDRKAVRIFIIPDDKKLSAAKIREVLDAFSFEAYYIIGNDFFKSSLQEKVSFDLVALPIIAGLVLLLLFFLWFQDARSVLVIISILGLNLAFVTCIFWLTGISVGILTATVPLLILVLSFCDIVHVIHRYKKQDQTNPVNHRIASTTKPLRLSLWLTSLTTFSAFALFFLSGIDEIVHFAIVTCSGIGMAYLTARYILPTFLVFFKIEAFKRKEAFSGLSALLLRLQKRHKMISVGALLLIVALGTGAWIFSTINSSFHQRMSADTEMGNSLRLADDHFDGTRSIEVIISSSNVLTTKTILEVDQIEKYLLENYGCRSVFSVNSVIKRMNRYQHYGTRSYYRLPDDLSSEMVWDLMKYKDKLGLGNAVTEDQETLRIIGRLPDIGSAKAEAKNLQLEKYLEKFQSNDQHVFISGFSYVKDQSTMRVTYLILLGIALSLLIVGIISGVVFRSAKIGIISILPNLLPLLGALLFIEVLGIGLNATSVMALSILLGLSLDDTIYFLGNNYVKGTRGVSVSSIKKSIKENTFPVMVTSLILAAGFAVLSFSEVQSNRNIGILVAAMLLIALISDLLIFPALLRVVAKTKKM